MWQRGLRRALDRPNHPGRNSARHFRGRTLVSHCAYAQPGHFDRRQFCADASGAGWSVCAFRSIAAAPCSTCPARPHLAQTAQGLRRGNQKLPAKLVPAGISRPGANPLRRRLPPTIRCCAVVRELLAEFPELDARLIVCGENLGANAKVSTLRQLEPHIRHPLVMISDADVRVPPDFAANVAPLLADPGARALSIVFIAWPIRPPPPCDGKPSPSTRIFGRKCCKRAAFAGRFRPGRRHVPARRATQGHRRLRRAGRFPGRRLSIGPAGGAPDRNESNSRRWWRTAGTRR